jgi:hypothetical protein
VVLSGATEQPGVVDPQQLLRLGNAGPKLEGALGEIGRLAVGQTIGGGEIGRLVLRRATGWSPADA